MSQYLIDTDICIHFLKGKFGIKDKIKEIGTSNRDIYHELLELLSKIGQKLYTINLHRETVG